MKEDSLNQRPGSIGNKKSNNELTSIARLEGIRPVIQRWLRGSFNINSVEELAQLSVNTLLFRLEDDGKCYSRHEVESWIAQAQELVAQKTPWQTSANFIVSLQNRYVGEQLEQRTTVYFIEADRKATWPGIEFNGVYELMLEQLKQSYQEDSGEPTMRIFLPEDRSDVVKSESEDADFTADWGEIIAGLSSDDLNRVGQTPQPSSHLSPVVVSEANETSESPTEDGSAPSSGEVSELAVEEKLATDEIKDAPEVVAEDKLATESEELSENDIEDPPRLEITQIKIYPPVDSKKTEAEDTEAKEDSDEDEKVMVIDATKRLLLGHLPKEKPFDLEVIFQLTGSGALDLTKQPLPYHTEVYGQNRTTRQKLTLGKAPEGYLVNGELTYICRLPEVILPEAGSYQLHIISSLDGASVSPDYLELPFVQVA